MSRNRIIQVDNISFAYDNGKQKVVALSEISISVDAGDFLAVTGPSGSGKSTLVHILGCLLKPTSGSYRLDSRETTKMSKNDLARVRSKLFGFVFQNYNLLPKVTALQNVRLPHRYSKLNPKKSMQISMALLERVGLSDRMQHKPNQMSGGEQQRVAVARALANKPKILIADEPTGSLDSRNSRSIMTLFQELVDDGLTVIFVTHDPDLVGHADKVIRLADSRLVSS